jgi:hypothetical protein
MNAFFRSYLILFSLLSTGWLWGQTDSSPESSIAAVNSPGSDSRAQAPGNAGWEYNTADFIVEAKSRGVGVRSFERPLSLENGYYLITGAFKESKNLQRLIRKLEKKGLDAGSFVNPENGLHYVYTQYYVVPELALDAAVTKLDGRYKDDMWILIVGDPGSRASIPAEKSEIATEEEAQEPARGTERSAMAAPQDFAQGDPEANSDALLRKADLYFDKMWYAEAAQLYESALKRHPEYRNTRIMQRVGDAHYFNTNMERANFW